MVKLNRHTDSAGSREGHGMENRVRDNKSDNNYFSVGERFFPCIASQVCAVMVMGFGLIALLGWIDRSPLLTTFFTNDKIAIVMAPSTALFFLFYGIVIYFHARLPQTPVSCRVSHLLAWAGTALSLLLLILSLLGIRLAAEHYGLTIVDTLDGKPIGHMTSITAICFTLAGFAFLALLSSSGRRYRATAAFSFAAIIILANITFLSFYLFDRSLLDGIGILLPAPMAMLTFVILGTAILMPAAEIIWRHDNPSEIGIARNRYVYTLAFLFLAMGIIMAGYLYLLNFERHYRTEVEEHLSSISSMKVEEVVDWREDYLKDAATLFKNVSFRALARRYFEYPGDADTRDQLQTWINTYPDSFHFDSVRLLDNRSKMRIAVPDGHTSIPLVVRKTVGEVLQSRQIAFMDMYTCDHCRKAGCDECEETNCSDCGKNHMAVLIPILDDRDDNRVSGVLYMRIDPTIVFYPFIQHWPDLSWSGEILIVRREGNDILFLNDLKFKENTALKLRIPIDKNQEISSVEAALDEVGVVQGIDYRGVPVIASILPIPKSPWYLIAKLDVSEVYLPVRDRMWMTLGLVGVLLLGMGLSLWLIWQQRRMQYYWEKYKAENALRESEERFGKIFEEGPLGMAMANSEYRFIRANESFCRMMGYAEQELSSMTFKDITHPDNLDRDIESIEKLVRGEIPIYRIEKRYVRKDGKNIWGALTSCIIRDAEGQFSYFFNMVDDITERKRAELAIREAELKYRIIADNTYDWEFWTAPTGDFLYVSPSCRRITGYEASEFLKNPDLMRGIIHPDDLSAWDNHRHEAEIGRAGSISFRIFRSDFSERWIEHVCQPVYDSQGEFIGTRGNNRDITETKRLQELASRAQRLETAGKIAGQVAHDFNNLLGPMIAYPEMIREELPADHSILPFIKDIENAAQQIAEINQQLLTLGRRGHYNQTILNLNHIVRQAVRDLGMLPDTLICELDLPENLFNIRGGSAQLHRVISNLLNNARDAMRDIGQITIKTENYYVDDVSITYERVPKGEYVKLTIADTGCGISDNIIQKIFDPFFTTKTTDKKRGSGLGMSVVDAVIKDHNGYIDLSTKVGQGTSFYIYFPITRAAIDNHDSEIIAGGNEKILIVDDDDLQRKVSKQLLAKLGYEVTTVESGEKAVELVRDNPQDLLVLDMIMPPGIDGTETYRRVSQINPSQKAIIVSGFSESNRVFEAHKLGVGAFVRKPLTQKALAAAVRTELDRKNQVSAA